MECSWQFPSLGRHSTRQRATGGGDRRLGLTQLPTFLLADELASGALRARSWPKPGVVVLVCVAHVPAGPEQVILGVEPPLGL
jgi:hypothetical protein